MIAVYPTERYDAWDLLLSGAAFSFGFQFIQSGADKDWFASALGSLICAVGFSVAITSFLSITFFPNLHQIVDCKPWPDVPWIFIVSMILAIGTYKFLVKNRI